MLQPGKYLAKVIDAGLTDSQYGPQPAMEFRLESGETIKWYGSFKDGNDDWATKAVVAAGFIGRSWEDFALGMTKFQPQEVELVVEMGKPNAAGKVYPRVKYVNSPKAMKVLDPSMVKGKVPAGLGFLKTAKVEKPDAGF